MFTTEDLNDLVEDYMNHCNCKPTRKGLALWLHISVGTVNNVIAGYYNHKPYGLKPHISRVIENKDFCIIRSLFG